MKRYDVDRIVLALVEEGQDNSSRYGFGLGDVIRFTPMQVGTILSDLDIEPEQRWIPCSERLPEHDGEMYLVTDYCEQINRKRVHISYCYMNREGFWSDVPIGYKVIAWMPLPEPYREGRTDG